MHSVTSLFLGALICVQFCHAVIYTDTWAAHIEGGEERAKRVAEKHGFTYLGKIFDDHYHLHHRSVAKRSLYASPTHHEELHKEPEVKWVEQQVAKRRVKRDNMFSDPKWPRMWYLMRGHGLDMNVKPAWQKGYTGKGVVVTILDDGIEKDHPDLKKNYNADASFDVNGNDPDPQPRYDYTNENRHGTRCAGEVAAEANNGICSVGVAYNAGIGGVRMLDGDVTDAVEARSLSHHPQVIDIYSASWGPDDDGRTVDGPGRLARKAFKDGIVKGRRGQGSIFVWASGNGGRDGDSCNCDGYTNSIYTLSISSVTENGHVPWYSEPCSSTLATTYSSGSGGERQIVTTDLRKSCTETHTGTSASAPLAAGLVALALEANPALTWRDMQHIVVRTSKPGKLQAEDWITNAVGRKVSHHFGYGLMDGSAMVDLARNWTTVPEQHVCEISSKDVSRSIPVNGHIEVYLFSDGCMGGKNRVMYLEHVQAIVSISSTRRGELRVYLTSPYGTKSALLPHRARDISTEGFNHWAFMTTHNWGEVAYGRWTLEVVNGGSSSTLHEWSLVLYGTATDPQNGQHSYQEGSGKHPECETDKYSLDGKCLEECPEGYYAKNVTFHSEISDGNSTVTGVCKSCKDGCNICEAKNLDHCKPCFKMHDFQSSGKLCESKQYFLEGACYSKCPAGYYPSNCTFQLSFNSTSNSTFSTGVCRPCISGCESCEAHDPDHCTSCLGTHHLLSTGKCMLLVPVTTTDENKLIPSKVSLILQGIDPILAAIVLCFVGLIVFVLIFLLLQCRERLKSCLCCCCNKGYKNRLDIRGKYQIVGRKGEFVDVTRIDRQKEESDSLLDSIDEDDMSVDNYEDSMYSSRPISQIGTAHMPDYLMNLATGK